MTEPAPLIDDWMPAYHVSEVHQLVIEAPAGSVWAALQQVSMREVPMFRALMALRRLPARLAARRTLPGNLDRPILAEMLGGGFLPLAQRPPCELVMGLIARPWRMSGGLAAQSPAAGFKEFEEPGWAKVVLGFRLEENAGRTSLQTETRVRATDPVGRRRFRLYWLVVGWGSSTTRRAWLRAVKRRAEVPDGADGSRQ